MPITKIIDSLATHVGTAAGRPVVFQRDHQECQETHRAGRQEMVSLVAQAAIKRRNPNVTGDGWQLRRFDPVDPASAEAVALAEGEKDAAIMAAAGLIAFTAPRGAQSLPLADFTELVELAKDTGRPVLLCGDNDLVGRDAMRKVRGLLKRDHHLDATYLFGEGKGSVADLPIKDLLALIRVKLSNPWYVTPSPAVVGETGPGDEL